MKIIYILLALISNYATAQYNPCYYYNINKGAVFLYDEDKPEKALSFYEEAFRIQPNGTYPLFNGLMKCYALQNNKDKFLLFFEKAVLKGSRWDRIEESLVGTQVLDSTDWKVLRQKYDSLHVQFDKGINWRWHEQVKVLKEKEQYIRSLEDNLCNMTQEQMFCLEDNVDSINMVLLINFVKENGFPSHDELGRDGYVSFKLLLTHGIHFKWVFDFFEPILRAQMEKGNFFPTEYASLVDSYMLSIGKGQIYGENNINKEKKHSKIDDIKTVDTRRFSIGLVSLTDQIKATWRKISQLPEGYVYSELEEKKLCKN